MPTPFIANRWPLFVGVMVLLCGISALPRRACAGDGSQAQGGVASCGAAAGDSVQVEQDVAPIKVSTDYGLATIASLAKRVKPSDGPAPKGFYVSAFTYSIQVKPTLEPAGCEVQPEIRVALRLTRRMIELGRELQRKPCAWNAELQHYQRHAKADETVLAQYASLVRQDLESKPPPAGNLAVWAHARIEDDLGSLGAARRAAQEAVNTQDEMARLYGACSV